jgi:hypothetical protein
MKVVYVFLAKMGTIYGSAALAAAQIAALSCYSCGTAS